MTLLHQELTSSILSCAYKVHSALGPGLLESAYEECFYYELDKKGLFVIKQKPMPLVYEEKKLELDYRIDLLVEGKVVNSAPRAVVFGETIDLDHWCSLKKVEYVQTKKRHACRWAAVPFTFVWSLLYRNSKSMSSGL
jgi:hypothetical protein